MPISIVGFAVADEDRERLARLVGLFRGRGPIGVPAATLPVMESLARAERLRDLQARNAGRAAATGQDYEALQTGIRESYEDGTRSR
jgi:hypothetical protein